MKRTIQHEDTQTAGDAEAEFPIEALVHAGKAASRLHQAAPRPVAESKPFEWTLEAVIEAHIEITAHADSERNVIFDKEFKPFVAEELTVGKQKPDRFDAEQSYEAADKRFALRHGRAAAMIQDIPQHRDARTLGCDAKHQQIDVSGANFPVGPVEAKPVGRGELKQRYQRPREPARVEPHCWKKRCSRR